MEQDFLSTLPCFKRLATIYTACCIQHEGSYVFYHTSCAYVTDDFDDKLRLLSEATVTGWSLEQNTSFN